MILKTIHSEMKPLRMKHFDMTIQRHSLIILIKMLLKMQIPKEEVIPLKKTALPFKNHVNSILKIDPL